MNLLKGSLMEANLDLFPIVLSMFLLVRLKTSLELGWEDLNIINYGDIYEEYIKIGIWKTTSKYLQFCSHYLF